jgi:hypothetical protein
LSALISIALGSKHNHPLNENVSREACSAPAVLVSSMFNLQSMTPLDPDKKRKIVSWLVPGIFLLIGVIRWTSVEMISQRSMRTLMKEQTRLNITEIPADYLALFKKDVKKKFSNVQGMIMKGRNPMVAFDIDSTYFLTMYRIPLAGGKPLPGMFHAVDMGDINASSAYQIFSPRRYEVYLRYAIDSLVKELYVGFNGRADTILKEADRLYDDLEDGNFSLQYTKDGLGELYIKKWGSILNARPAYKGLLLMREGNFLYILIAARTKKPFDANVLLQLLKTDN